mmetsp:Transcript_5914/g.13763  ORF Transcript_5914/g.13763 Transcript_5914/m.13763 type:complete len:220 (+) Transcript_5914:1055-1714(+)
MVQEGQFAEGFVLPKTLQVLSVDAHRVNTRLDEVARVALFALREDHFPTVQLDRSQGIYDCIELRFLQGHKDEMLSENLSQEISRLCINRLLLRFSLHGGCGKRHNGVCASCVAHRCADSNDGVPFCLPNSTVFSTARTCIGGSLGGHSSRHMHRLCRAVMVDLRSGRTCCDRSSRPCVWRTLGAGLGLGELIAIYLEGRGSRTHPPPRPTSTVEEVGC